MKRLGSPDTLAGLVPLCPITEEHSPKDNHVYTTDIQSMMNELDEGGCCIEESRHVPEKKRRLSVNQVKSLEKYFEVENKLQSERKVKLAQELGLQPRQVAVWFQNRRARWKTKQLERDYGVLKSSYDALKLDYDTIKYDTEALLKEVKDMKANLQDNKIIIKNPKSSPPLTPIALPETIEFNFDSFKNQNNDVVFKDCSSDSGSSAILQEDNSPNAAAISSYCGVLQSNPSVVMYPIASSLNFNQCSTSPAPSSSMNYFQYMPQQYVKLEEQSLYSTDDACDFFSDELAPLQWYYPDQWN